MSKDPSYQWHAEEIDSVLDRLEVASSGLSAGEVETRLEKYGLNQIPQTGKSSALVVFLKQFHNVFIYLLLVASIVTGLLDHLLDSAVILAVVIVNALIGFIQERKAEQAIQSLSKLLSIDARVRRDGKVVTITADKLVPGDIVILQSGARVPADLRLFVATELEVDESMLTGESAPVQKDLASVSERASVADRSCMAFSGTMVVRGQGEGVIVATGKATELGQISDLVNTAEEITTPLIQQINQFAKSLSLIIVCFAAATLLFGILVRGEEAGEMFLAAVALAVAAIPEGLPAVLTITLALGVRRMAAKNAIIRNLPAVDTLGAVTVICSDKTGTLTRNEMVLERLALAKSEFAFTGKGYQPEGEVLDGEGQELAASAVQNVRAALKAAVLCSDSEISKTESTWAVTGDPMEGALLAGYARAGGELDDSGKYELIDSVPFSSERKFMAHLREVDDQLTLYLKGAPEVVLERCTANCGAEEFDRASWEELANSWTQKGRRTLGIATKKLKDSNYDRLEDHCSELEFIGLAIILDPPRPEAKSAIADCHAAGITVKMITGDHLGTALSIGRELSLPVDQGGITGAELEGATAEQILGYVSDKEIFARVSPEHKLKLVAALQSRNEVVAMTGDGVNDAPALKKADVGIAMGKKGTEAAREASDMVLADDNFASIASAVREGRTIYDNIRKSILFILPTNGAEALTILLAILLGRTLPITPVQILWINMITAVTLALALAFEPAEPDIMQRSPRSTRAKLLTPYLIWRIIFVCILICTATFGVFILLRNQGASIEMARTMAVNMLVMMEIFYLWNSRFLLSSVLSVRALTGNLYILGAVALTLIFQCGFTYLPFMQALFGTTAIGLSDWALLVVCGIVLFLVIELEKAIQRHFRASRNSS